MRAISALALKEMREYENESEILAQSLQIRADVSAQAHPKSLSLLSVWKNLWGGSSSVTQKEAGGRKEQWQILNINVEKTLKQEFESETSR